MFNNGDLGVDKGFQHPLGQIISFNTKIVLCLIVEKIKVEERRKKKEAHIITINKNQIIKNKNTELYNIIIHMI